MLFVSYFTCPCISLVFNILIFDCRFAPDNEWFIETMNEVFELGGNLVRPQVAHNLMQLIGEGISYLPLF